MPPISQVWTDKFSKLPVFINQGKLILLIGVSWARANALQKSEKEDMTDRVGASPRCPHNPFPISMHLSSGFCVPLILTSST